MMRPRGVQRTSTFSLWPYTRRVSQPLKTPPRARSIEDTAALEVAVQLAEAIRAAEARIIALEATHAEMRAATVDVRYYAAIELPALAEQVNAASVRAQRAEAALARARRRKC